MKDFLQSVSLMKDLKILMKLLLNKNRRIDMMIKLYALEVMEGNIKWKEIPFSPIIKDRIKACIRKLVEDDEVFNELTKED